MSNLAQKTSGSNDNDQMPASKEQRAHLSIGVVSALISSIGPTVDIGRDGMPSKFGMATDMICVLKDELFVVADGLGDGYLNAVVYRLGLRAEAISELLMEGLREAKANPLPNLDIALEFYAHLDPPRTWHPAVIAAARAHEGADLPTTRWGDLLDLIAAELSGTTSQPAAPESEVRIKAAPKTKVKAAKAPAARRSRKAAR